MEELDRLAPSDLNGIYELTGNEFVCQICGKMFDKVGQLNLHKSGAHFNNRHAEDNQWDYGQLDLANGVNALWSDFMHEHNLPRTVFLYGDRYLSKNFRDVDAYMPKYSMRKVKDEITGALLDAVCIPDAWLKLDPDAKCSMLAHMAAHVENRRCGIYDVSFNKTHHHGLKFKATAESYDLKVLFSEFRGWSICLLDDDFRAKHKYAMTLIARHHPLKVLHGRSNDYKCFIDSKIE